MTAPDPDALARLDRTHVWHPYTQMLEYGKLDAPIIERGEGVRLQDTKGRWYWDGVSSIWLNVHGHRVPAIDQAVRDQLDKVAHTTLLGQGNVPSILLAERLAKIAPSGLRHVFYSDNGSCANEAALKMALQYWHAEGSPDKTRTVSFQDGYHGDTLGAVGVAPVPLFHDAFRNVLPRNHQAPYPDCYRDPGDHARGACTRRHLEPVAELLEDHGEETAAFFVEPMAQGVGGVRIMPPGFLRGVRDLCTKHDVLLVADEVATGFGRTGKLWACDHDDVVPDLMTVGKGITGGYLPLAATLVPDRLYDAFLGRHEDNRTFYHGHSYTGNQLACAAGLASLELLRDLLPRLPEREAAIRDGLAPLHEHPHVGDIRQLGLMAGIELVADKATKAPFPSARRAGYLVTDAARPRGLLVRPIGNIPLFLPPLASTPDEIDAMLTLYRAAFDDATPHLARLAERTLARVPG